MATFGKVSLLVIPFALSLAACGQPSVSSTKDIVAPKNLVEGKWVSPCLFNSEPDATTGVQGDKSTRQSWINFTATDVSSLTKSYDKENCADFAFTITTSSSYRLADHPTNPKLKLIDYTLKSISFVYHEPSVVDQLNDIEFCGFKDWKADVPREISGLACFDSSTFLPKKGDAILDVWQRDGDKLFFGRPLSGDLVLPGVGNAAGQRPTAVITKEYVGIDTTP